MSVDINPDTNPEIFKKVYSEYFYNRLLNYVKTKSKRELEKAIRKNLKQKVPRLEGYVVEEIMNKHYKAWSKNEDKFHLIEGKIYTFEPLGVGMDISVQEHSIEDCHKYLNELWRRR